MDKNNYYCHYCSWGIPRLSNRGLYFPNKAVQFPVDTLHCQLVPNQSTWLQKLKIVNDEKEVILQTEIFYFYSSAKFANLNLSAKVMNLIVCYDKKQWFLLRSFLLGQFSNYRDILAQRCMINTSEMNETKTNQTEINSLFIYFFSWGSLRSNPCERCVKSYLPTYESQKTGHPATLGLVYAVPNLGTLRMVRVCILTSIMEGFKGLKFFTIS